MTHRFGMRLGGSPGSGPLPAATSRPDAPAGWPEVDRRAAAPENVDLANADLAKADLTNDRTNVLFRQTLERFRLVIGVVRGLTDKQRRIVSFMVEFCSWPQYSTAGEVTVWIGVETVALCMLGGPLPPGTNRVDRSQVQKAIRRMIELGICADPSENGGDRKGGRGRTTTYHLSTAWLNRTLAAIAQWAPQALCRKLGIHQATVSPSKGVSSAAVPALHARGNGGGGDALFSDSAAGAGIANGGSPAALFGAVQPPSSGLALGQAHAMAQNGGHAATVCDVPADDRSNGGSAAAVCGDRLTAGNPEAVDNLTGAPSQIAETGAVEGQNGGGTEFETAAGEPPESLNKNLEFKQAGASASRGTPAASRRGTETRSSSGPMRQGSMMLPIRGGLDRSAARYGDPEDLSTTRPGSAPIGTAAFPAAVHLSAGPMPEESSRQSGTQSGTSSFDAWENLRGMAVLRAGGDNRLANLAIGLFDAEARKAIEEGLWPEAERLEVLLSSALEQAQPLLQEIEDLQRTSAKDPGTVKTGRPDPRPAAGRPVRHARPAGANRAGPDLTGTARQSMATGLSYTGPSPIDVEPPESPPAAFDLLLVAQMAREAKQEAASSKLGLQEIRVQLTRISSLLETLLGGSPPGNAGQSGNGQGAHNGTHNGAGETDIGTAGRTAVA